MSAGMTMSTDNALHAQIIRRLVPDTKRADLYSGAGRFLGSSSGDESPAVSAIVVRQLRKLERAGQDVRGSQHMAGDHCVTLLVIRNAQLDVLGMAVCHHPKESGTAPPGTPEQLANAATPMLQLLAAQQPRPPDCSLLSRHEFELQATARLASTGGTPQCLVYGNLDRLHLLNGRLGFGRCDLILAQVVELWSQHAARTSAIACHISGDRFVTLLKDQTLNHARTWAEQLRTEIAALPLPADCTDLSLSCSIGIAPIGPESTLSLALAEAEAACKAAKDRGRNRIELFEAGDASLVQRHEDVEIFRNVTNALEQGKFILYAQPITRIAAPEHPRHYEILLRMRREDDSVAAPDEFLSAAVRYQLMNVLDQWVISEVIRQLAPHAGPLAADRHTFWINLSGQSLAQADFADMLRTQVKASAVPARSLGFEITENAAIGNLDRAKRCIARLREVGCDFALDDFGTGLSSLAYLKDLNISKLKIAGKFVSNMSNDPKSDSMVRAVVRMAQQLGLRTTAECIENEETARHARALGITYGQGYLFGPPRSLQGLLAELATRWQAGDGQAAGTSTVAA
jgi:diguanylate cyclase (GGDEF)-like protein